MNFYKKTKSAGGVVLNKKGLILVVNQDGQTWSLPKGHLEEGESLLEAAKREIWEESGITDLEMIKELGNYQRHKLDEKGNEDKSEFKTIFMFFFKTKEENLSPVDKNNPEAKWVEKEKVAELLTHPKDKEFFLKVKDEIEDY